MAAQSIKKYNRLMEKAEELFMTVGYKLVTMDEIAAAAGISKMTIYKHFPSKEDLYAEVLIQWGDRYMADIEERLSKIPTAVEKIETLFTLGLEQLHVLPMVLFRDIVESPYVLKRMQEYKVTKGLTLWKAILREGMEKGEIRSMDIDFVSQFLAHMAESFDWPKMLSKGHCEDEKKNLNWTVENLYDFLKYGLLGGNKK